MAHQSWQCLMTPESAKIKNNQWDDVMFDTGLTEWALVLLVGLLALGPKHLPAALQQLIQGITSLRRFVMAMQAEINRQYELDEITAHVSQKRQQLTQNLSNDMQRYLQKLPTQAATPAPSSAPTPTLGSALANKKS